MDAPATSCWLAKWRRPHYCAVAAELMFGNKSRSPNCWAAGRLLRLLVASPDAGLVALRVSLSRRLTHNSVASSPARRSSASCSAFSCSGVMAARQREIRLPAKAKACDVCANAAFRISTLHWRCLHDVIWRPLCVIQRALHSGLLGRI